MVSFFFPFNLYSTGEWRIYRRVRRQCGGMTYMILSGVDSNTDPCSKDSHLQYTGHQLHQVSYRDTLNEYT